MKTFFLCLICFASTAAYPSTKALDQLVYQIRNPDTDAPNFRQALESIGEYLALRVLEEFPTEETTVVTLTGKEATHHLIKEQPALVTILRAGLPLNTGVQKVFPKAETGFFAMARNEETLKAITSYIALPDLKDRYVILSDTMLATGGSLIDALTILEEYGPKKIFVITAIASKEGVERVLKAFPSVSIFSAAIDPSLNEKGYIIPGLGDAGDRTFGMKVAKH